MNRLSSNPLQQYSLLLIGEIEDEMRKLWKLLTHQGYSLDYLSLEDLSAKTPLHRPDLILLSDQSQTDSFEHCQDISNLPVFSNIPIIFLCVHPSSLNRSKIFQSGAVDYLFAPFVPEETFKRIDTHLSIVYLTQELALKEKQLQQTVSDFQIIESSLHRANQELAESSFLDLTTQLFNRQRFEQSLLQEWRKSTRDRILWGDSNLTTLSILISVIDNFGEYIQKQGEDEAEKCLKVVGDLIKETVNRPGDIVARYNEIAIALLLPNTPQEGALRVAEILRENIQEAQLPHPIQPQLTISLGIISAIPSQALSTDVLFNAIDNLLNNSLCQGIEQLICDNL